MAFLTPDDIGQVMYEYQVTGITEGDEGKVIQALAAGEEETRSYLEINANRHQSMDGRLIYDVAAIFSATGTNRHALILQQAVTIAKWHLVQLCNADVIAEQAEKRYDRAVVWLNKLSSGAITLSTLPTITPGDSGTTTGPFESGSREKFNHEF